MKSAEALRRRRRRQQQQQQQQGSNDEPSTEEEDNENRTALIVHRTLNNATRRKKDIIVTGLPETGSVGGDRNEFLQLCERNLTIKPFVADNGCIRIGKSNPRRMLVKLSSEEVAATILRDAPRLRQWSYSQNIASSVYINPDLSPAAAKRAYETRQLRRQQ